MNKAYFAAILGLLVGLVVLGSVAIEQAYERLKTTSLKHETPSKPIAVLREEPLSSIVHGTRKHVAIDLLPQTFPNVINCADPDQVVDVAILSNDIFDAATLEPGITSLGLSDIDRQLQDQYVQNAGEYGYSRNYLPVEYLEDVNEDGRADAVLHFRVGDAKVSCTEKNAIVLGHSSRYGFFYGLDNVTMTDKPIDATYTWIAASRLNQSETQYTGHPLEVTPEWDMIQKLTQLFTNADKVYSLNLPDYIGNSYYLSLKLDEYKALRDSLNSTFVDEPTFGYVGVKYYGTILHYKNNYYALNLFESRKPPPPNAYLYVDDLNAITSHLKLMKGQTLTIPIAVEPRMVVSEPVEMQFRASIDDFSMVLPHGVKVEFEPPELMLYDKKKAVTNLILHAEEDAEDGTYTMRIRGYSRNATYAFEGGYINYPTIEVGSGLPLSRTECPYVGSTIGNVIPFLRQNIPENKITLAQVTYRPFVSKPLPDYLEAKMNNVAETTLWNTLRPFPGVDYSRIVYNIDVDGYSPAYLEPLYAARPEWIYFTVHANAYISDTNFHDSYLVDIIYYLTGDKYTLTNRVHGGNQSEYSVPYIPQEARDKALKVALSYEDIAVAAEKYPPNTIQYQFSDAWDNTANNCAQKIGAKFEGREAEPNMLSAEKDILLISLGKTKECPPPRLPNSYGPCYVWRATLNVDPVDYGVSGAELYIPDGLLR